MQIYLKSVKFFCLTILIYLLTLFTYCSDSGQTAEKYNRDIIIQLKLVLLQEDSLIEMIGKNKPEKINARYKKILNQINVSTYSIQSLKDPDKDSSLKMKALSLLNTYKTITKSEYTEVVRIAGVPDKDFTKGDDEVIKLASKEINTKLDSALVIFIKTEKQFAAKHLIEQLSFKNY